MNLNDLLDAMDAAGFTQSERNNDRLRKAVMLLMNTPRPVDQHMERAIREGVTRTEAKRRNYTDAYTPTDETRGLYSKYYVKRADGTDEPGGQHANCDYFVLDMTHDPFAGPAMRAYERHCRDKYPKLSADLARRFKLYDKPPAAICNAATKDDPELRERVNAPLVAALAEAARGDEHTPFFDVVFDGPPSAESGRFVEVEDEQGRSFNAGEWIDRGDGTWALRIGRAPGVAATTDEQRQRVQDAIAEALGDAYDCTRVWGAWGVGTMSEDDFARVADDSDRVAEIADAAIGAMSAAPTEDIEVLKRDSVRHHTHLQYEYEHEYLPLAEKHGVPAIPFERYVVEANKVTDAYAERRAKRNT